VAGTRQIALLRGIDLGVRAIGMAELRRVLAAELTPGHGGADGTRRNWSSVTRLLAPADAA
jgi:uncharacterized protein (DUF1697 family)